MAIKSYLILKQLWWPGQQHLREKCEFPQFSRVKNETRSKAVKYCLILTTTNNYNNNNSNSIMKGEKGRWETVESEREINKENCCWMGKFLRKTLLLLKEKCLVEMFPTLSLRCFVKDFLVSLHLKLNKFK